MKKKINYLCGDKEKAKKKKKKQKKEIITGVGIVIVSGECYLGYYDSRDTLIAYNREVLKPI